MNQFQQLLRASLLAGAIAGAVLFCFQYAVVVPRILAAEAYETHEHHDHSHAEEWKPAEGLERNYYTAASTVLTGIGYAALLLSIASLTGLPLTVRNGLLWGLAGFACFSVAPSLGNPPEPPGVPAADLAARQLWWLLTVTATATGLFLATKKRLLIAVILIALPHLLGAPHLLGTPRTSEISHVPAALIHQFTFAALAGNALFWLILGPLAGKFGNPE